MICQRQPIPSPKSDTVRHVAEQSSWVPWPSCSPPRHPFPVKSLAVSACVSSDNSFLSVRQEPTLRPWKGVLFPVITLSQFSHPFNGDCGPMGTVRQGWTLASSLMGHRCHQHTPGSTSLMASHQPGCSLSSLDWPQGHVNW